MISAENRNFPGRSGPGQMYLASPYTVAASAVAGYVVEYEPSEEHALVRAQGGSIAISSVDENDLQSLGVAFGDVAVPAD